MNVGFISLGCSKNLVDTEMMIGIFKENKFNIVNDPKIADVIVINTCGFIESAKEEAINTILEMAEYKKTGKCKVLIATGCLVERYKEDLEKALPEVDIFLKYSDYAEEKGNSSVVFAKVLKEVYDKIESKKNVKLVDTDLNFMNRVITTGEQYSYIRIAEGCSNRCTYCAIPYIRGNFVSRKMEDIIEEAKQIVSTGRRELILIAQDTSKYGKDIYGKPKLAELLTELCKIKDLKWVRFLYTYPEDITDELIKVVKENDKICKYFDIPIQHISDTVLKRMNRKCTGQSIKNTISKLRKEIPDVVIRTTLMVGFPGETQEDFEKLYEFVKETKFDKLGAFTYSKEDGTPASRLKEQIHPMKKKSRYNKIMKLQQEISKENEKKNIGGRAMQVVRDVPSIPPEHLVGSLAEQTEPVLLEIIKLNGEELSRVWNNSSKTIRPSFAVDISQVFMQSNRVRSAAPRITSAQFNTNPSVDRKVKPNGN